MVEDVGGCKERLEEGLGFSGSLKLVGRWRIIGRRKDGEEEQGKKMRGETESQKEQKGEEMRRKKKRRRIDKRS